MLTQTPAYRNHLRNIQNEIDAKKLQELWKLHLFNEKTFYRAFVDDLLKAKKEVVIYSPFISKFRSEFFKRTLAELRRKNICVFIFTRPLEEHDYLMRSEIKCALKDYEELGVCIIYPPGLIHQKIAIIDREILWEGSLNILSQRESHEMMIRTADEDCAKQVMSYLEINKALAEGYKFQYERLCRNLIENSKRNLGMKLKQIASKLGSLAISVLTWSVQACLKVVILSLKSVKLLMDLIKMII